MRFALLPSLTVLVSMAASAALAATEYPIGKPVTRDGMEIGANYLTGIEMENMKMPMDKDEVHLEMDAHAAADEKHGFAKGAWIPYLTINYTLQKTGGAKKEGKLLPMTAGDGPHYANNLAMEGPGEYHLTYQIDPPSKAGFLRHVDKATGVPAWWQPITVEWTFTYPAKAKGE